MVETKPFALRLDDGSRMSGDVHVRFCESLGVKFPRATHPAESSHSNPPIVGVARGRFTLRFQPVDATHSLNFSAGE